MISFRLTTILAEVKQSLTRIIIYDNGVVGALIPLVETIQSYIPQTSYLTDYQFNFFRSVFSEELVDGLNNSFISERIGLKLAAKTKSELTIVLLADQQLTLVIILFDYLKQIQIAWPKEEKLTNSWLVNQVSEKLSEFLAPLIQPK